MSDFVGELGAFSAILDGRAQASFEGIVAEAKRSVIQGSALTGSLGQPIGPTGETAAAWIEERPGPWVADILTHDPGAKTIEKGQRRGRRLRFHVRHGGAHSLKLTLLHARRILAAVARRVGGDG